MVLSLIMLLDRGNCALKCTETISSIWWKNHKNISTSGNPKEKIETRNESIYDFVSECLFECLCEFVYPCLYVFLHDCIYGFSIYMSILFFIFHFMY